MKTAERFLKYVSFGTASNAESDSVPSTKNQLELAKYLVNELKAMGIENAELSPCGYVYAKLPATCGCKDAPMGFIAHMDTSPSAPGENIRPQIIEYGGGDIALNENTAITEKDFPFLSDYVGQHLIVTDGTTLLGADDKAGIAEIFSAAEILVSNPQIPHGDIYIAVTPDEEIGRGADNFDFTRFAADFAYTVDGGTLGELEYENFNAATANIKINGVNIHPGSAKNKMKNASLIACELVNMLPEGQSPSCTEGYEGFYHLSEMSGNESAAKIEILIRDHDRDSFERRKEFIGCVAEFLNKKYGKNTVECEARDSYYNMKEKILPVFNIVERAERAMKKAGVAPKIVPIRGGTDGARLSFEGLPCPNLSTGGENFHGVHEFVSIEAMEKTVDIILNIATAQ